jgi:hypothetical protein
MRATITTNHGYTVQTATKCRYVLIREVHGMGQAYITHRSDSIAALMRARSRQPSSGNLSYFLADTVTGYSLEVGGNGTFDAGWLANQLAPEPQIDRVRLLAFAREVAHLRPDGEGTDDEGEPWVMENDDAVEALCGLIGEARAILGEPRDQPERWQS